VGSDEEPEIGDADESEEEIDEESEKEETPKAKKQKTPGQEVPAAVKPRDVDSDVDAEGEDDDSSIPVGAQPLAGGDLAAGRGRKRNIIEDEDDE